jgi:hypothetical protein
MNKICLSVILLAQVISIAVKAETRPRRRATPPVEIVGGKKVGEVIELKISEPFTIRFSTQFTVPASSRPVFVGVTPYNVQIPFDQIPPQVNLGKFLHCSMTSGANDPNDQKIFYNFSGLDKFAAEFGQITWLKPNPKNEITVSFSDPIYHTLPLKGPLDLHLNFSGIHATEERFYLREELKRKMPNDVTSLTRERAEARADRNPDNAIENCLTPNYSIKIRLVNTYDPEVAEGAWAK